MNIIAVFAVTLFGLGASSGEITPQPTDIQAGPCDPAVSRCL